MRLANSSAEIDHDFQRYQVLQARRHYKATAGELDYTAISIAISRFARRLASNPALRQACADCQEELAKCIKVEM